jgi:CAAX prenyl protease-like protein
MNFIRGFLGRSPERARFLPFFIFLVGTSLQGKFGAESHFWVYSIKTLLGVFLVWAMWPIVTEMRWAFSWEAVAIGVGVFVMWVGIDPFYPKWGKQEIVWNAPGHFGDSSPLAWFFVVWRTLGSGLVVPPMEEVFYRSFLYRYIINPDIEKVPLGKYDARAFWLTVIIFAAAHPSQWLAALLCGIAYGWLVIYKKRLGDAMTSHAITNIMLGIYVAWKGAWQFW